MSASTVSITANPATASRRRPVFAGENKLPIELANADGGAGQTNAIDDNTSGGKDLSHSIRGEVMVGRSKDLIQVKKSLPTSTVSPRRTRKAVTKPEKPRWQTIVSVFTKNFMLLLVLIGLAQIVRKLTLKSADSSVGLISSEVADIEGRIAEVEGFLKTTTKMMQVQVEVVDKKIENEVSGLRRELGKKIDDKSLVLENGLKKLDSRANILEKSFGELREMDLVTKEEFERFYEAFKKAKEDDSGDRYVSLDDLRAYAREVVAKEIEKHAADGLGWVDYALAAGGAAVLKHSDPYVVGKGHSWYQMTPGPNGVHRNAEKILKPSFGEPGQCFPLKGQTGFVQIRLRTAIIPEAVTLEHVAKSVAYDRSSAPKDCRVSGWLQGGGHNADLAGGNKMFLLAEFIYDLEKSNAQTFNTLETSGAGLVDTVRLDFTSNHGSPSHTCIYRFRVHGREPDSISALATQS